MIQKLIRNLFHYYLHRFLLFIILYMANKFILAKLKKRKHSHHLYGVASKPLLVLSKGLPLNQFVFPAL